MALFVDIICNSDRPFRVGVLCGIYSKYFS
jgi:hypothetical protein